LLLVVDGLYISCCVGPGVSAEKINAPNWRHWPTITDHWGQPPPLIWLQSRHVAN